MTKLSTVTRKSYAQIRKRPVRKLDQIRKRYIYIYRCAHGRQKSECKDCGGSGICEHGRIRRICKDCGGSSICEHGRLKSQCKACGGSSICEHRIQKAQCKACEGSAICEHRIQKALCKACGGIAFCEHGRRKAQCSLCAHCKHEKRKIDCGVCYKVQMKEIVDKEVKNASYGSTKDTNNLEKCRRLNKVVYSVAHKDAAFGHHAAGILADCYIREILKNNLGSPPAIVDFKIECSVEESKSVSSGFNVSY